MAKMSEYRVRVPDVEFFDRTFTEEPEALAYVATFKSGKAVLETRTVTPWTETKGA